MFNLKFLGGAETVTGSKFLLSTSQSKILVDCGMFQGPKDLRLKNWSLLKDSGVEPSTIQSVILTHAHIDHSGYLPMLVKQGFSGPIYCSPPTKDLVRLLLLDAAKLQEEDAEHANLHGYSKHKPALPLFTAMDVEKVLPLLNPIPMDDWVWINTELQIRLKWNGHILGSNFVEIQQKDGLKVVFSGDIGRVKPLTLNPPEIIEEADYLIMESTYGDRKHPKEDVYQRLADIIKETSQRGGQVIIPSFAVGRAQDVLHILSTIKLRSWIPDIPIYVDSPMAIQATKIFDSYSQYHCLGHEDCLNLSTVGRLVDSPESSQRLLERDETCVIIAGSGMMNGGRITRHLRRRITDEKNTVVIVGFQAAGTLGRFLYEGADEIKIFGQFYPVKARVEKIMSLSAHADQTEILAWLMNFKKRPKKVFIVHGESNAAEGLRVRIQDLYSCQVEVAKLNQEVELS